MIRSVIRSLAYVIVLTVGLPTLQAKSPITQLKSLTKRTTTKAVSMIAGGSLLLSATCGLNGCSAPVRYDQALLAEVTFAALSGSSSSSSFHSHDHTHFVKLHHGRELSVTRGGVVWHGHYTNGDYSQYGIDKLWGIELSQLRWYKINRDTLQASHYNNSHIVYVTNEGSYDVGAVSGSDHRQDLGLSQDEVLVFPVYSQKEASVINLDQILGVAVYHHQYRSDFDHEAYINIDNIMDTPWGGTLPYGEKFYGRAGLGYSNGWRAIELTKVLTESGSYVSLDKPVRVLSEDRLVRVKVK